MVAAPPRSCGEWAWKRRHVASTGLAFGMCPVSCSEARADREPGDRTGRCFVPEAWMSISETSKAYKMSRSDGGW